MKKALGILVVVLVVAAVAYSSMQQTETKKLTVLSWDYYIGPNTITDFEKEYGVKVTYELIKSNEEALARMKANPGVYDIAVISDYLVDTLRNEKGLEKLDKTKIANIKSIDKGFAGSYYDPSMDFSVPYAYGTSGFAVNTKHFTQPTITWKELTKPEYKGKVAVMDDLRYVLGSVLMELGYDPNTTDQKEIDEAVALFKQVTPNVLKFTSDSPVDLMVNEDAWISYGYSGDSLQMATDNPAITYFFPSYGGIKFVDNMVIPVGAPHADVAHEWMNFILRPDVSATITNEVQYGNPVTTAFDLIDEATRTSPAVFPPKEVFSKLQYIREIGDDIDLYNKAWESVKQ